MANIIDSRCAAGFRFELVDFAILDVCDDFFLSNIKIIHNNNIITIPPPVFMQTPIISTAFTSKYAMKFTDT